MFTSSTSLPLILSVCLLQVQSLGGRRVQDVGRTVTLKLKNKYANELLSG